MLEPLLHHADGHKDCSPSPQLDRVFLRLLLSDQPFFGGSGPSYADFAVAEGFAVGFLAAPLTLKLRGDHYRQMLQ